MLDRVLDRKLGMPITLSAVVIEVGQRMGLELTMIGMPGHVIVGTGVADNYIDAFGGVEVNDRWAQQRLESIFGPEANLATTPMPTLDVEAAVNRVCNNLMRTWIDDRTGKFDRLLELRSLLPTSSADRRLLLDVATGRGRFDIAAKIREINDPDDPEIRSLWAKLN